jgi:hypothetical protein
MKMGSILKIGLLVAGVYLAWRSGIFQTLGLTFLPAPPAPTPTPVPAGGGGTTAVPPASTLTTTPTVTGGGGTAATPPPATAQAAQYLSADQIDALIKSAAAGDIVAATQATALAIRMRFDQWNYYRSVKTGTDAPATPGLDQTGTANDYLAYRAAQGLSGLSLGGIPLGAIRIWGRAA